MKKPLRIDFHTHIISDEFPDLAAKYGDERFPIVHKTCECGADILIKGKNFRTITDQAWDPKKRIEDMNREGIDIQVLSPVPVTFAYWADPVAGLELAKSQNNFIASIVKENPERFIGLGTVPLQDVELAINEMKRAITELDLKGIEIGSNVNGQNLDDDELYPFFKAAAEWDVPLFIHPWATLGGERMQRHSFMYTVGMPSETALAIGSILMSGMLEKLPNLKLCFSHGGGALPYLLPRIDQGWEVWPHIRKTNYPPSYYAKKLYFDALVYDTQNLQYMVEKFGTKKIMAGSDYPFLLRETPAGKVIDDLSILTDEDRRLMLGENALNFLGIKQCNKIYI